MRNLPTASDRDRIAAAAYAAERLFAQLKVRQPHWSHWHFRTGAVESVRKLYK